MKDQFIWSELTFGRHQGKTLPQIVLSDPDWFFWAWHKKLFRPPFASEAKDIAHKICRIKIPRPNPEDWKFEFICNSDGKLLDLRLLEAEDAVYGHVNRQIIGVLDMSWPRLWGGYDKSSAKLLLAAIRHYYFRGSRMTKARCEAFFPIMPILRERTSNYLTLSIRGWECRHTRQQGAGPTSPRREKA